MVRDTLSQNACLWDGRHADSQRANYEEGCARLRRSLRGARSGEDPRDRSTYLVGYRMYVFGYTGLTGFIDAWTTWFQILKPR